MSNKLLVMMMACAIMLPLLTGCGQSATLANEPKLPFAQELQDALERGLEEYGGMGVSVAIIVPGYETWVGVSGVSHGTTLITPDTLFSAASITKNFTAATILQLAQEGALTLDDPLHKWLPDYPNVDNTITIRQLLNMTSGIYNVSDNPEWGDAMLADPARSWEPAEIITAFVLEPTFAKGTSWHYSNPSYLLLCMIIQEATGAEISTAYRSRFWTPLGLDRMFLAVEEALPEDTAHGWFDLDGDGGYDDLPIMTSLHSGVGGVVFANAKDLATWSQALYHKGSVLSQGSLEQMLTFHSPTPGEPLIAGYGLGAARFSPEITNGLEIWGHLGSALGYKAACLYLPEYGVSMGIATNTGSEETIMGVTYDLLNIVTSHVGQLP